MNYLSENIKYSPTDNFRVRSFAFIAIVLRYEFRYRKNRHVINIKCIGQTWPDCDSQAACVSFEQLVRLTEKKYMPISQSLFFTNVFNKMYPLLGKKHRCHQIRVCLRLLDVRRLSFSNFNHPSYKVDVYFRSPSGTQLKSICRQQIMTCVWTQFLFWISINSKETR
jgi:hypothetical protein